NYELVPGMYAYVQLPVSSAVNALTIPIQAVELTQPGLGTVLVVNGADQIEQRNVSLGIETPNEVEVLTGLREGDLIVFGEQNRYRAGERVKPESVKVASAVEEK
ncbi:MAG: hypothetical protein ACRD19_00035, partial [Terriglobia bacterium]